MVADSNSSLSLSILKFVASAFREAIVCACLMMMMLSCGVVYGEFPVFYRTDVRPEITSTYPASLIVHPNRFRDTEVKLIIRGRNIYPEIDERFGGQKQRLKVLLRRDSGFIPVDKVEMGEGEGAQHVTIYFSARKWLATPGDLEIQVQVDDMASERFPVPVVDTPGTRPDLSSISPNRFKVLYELPARVNEDEYYQFTIRGKNLDAADKSTLHFGNRRIPVEELEIKDGIIKGSVPVLFRNYPGTYNVRYRTPLGSSNTLKVILEEEPKEEQEQQGQGAQ